MKKTKLVKIGIIDYKINNISSVLNAFKKLNCKVYIIKKIKDFNIVDGLVLPGVGAFGKAMQNIKKKNFYYKIRKEVLKKKKPFLGICLGMQLMSNYSFENGFYKGLSLIKGYVKKITRRKNTRLPHVGWNNIKIKGKKLLFKDLPNNSTFYFVHSYKYVCNNKYVSSKTYHGEKIISSIQKKNIFGVQFHPEKSHRKGLDILSNFIKICENNA